MGNNLKILITNDDGIDAPGIKLLAQMALEFGQVWVVAPASQCSAMSQRITLRKPMELKQVDFPVPVEAAYSLEGTPADCVKAAINYVMEGKPDIVFSGMNCGINAGYDIAYSGTVGAAMEAIMNHVPAIAFSNQANKGVCESWECAKKFAAEITKNLLTKEISKSEIWNVNFPSCSIEACKGIKWDVPVAPVQVFNDNFEVTRDEEGRLYLAEAGKPMPFELIPKDTDCWCIFNNYVSVGKIKSMVL